MTFSDISSFLSQPDAHVSKPLPISLIGSFEALEAALWLIAGDNLPQALSLLYNSLELAMKAELTKIHPLLIVDVKRLDYETLKMFLRDEFQKHPHGAHMKIKPLDLDRTITFTDALARIKEVYPELGKWEPKLKILQTYRNQITHSGDKKEDFGNYSHAIISGAIPFLADFFRLTNQVLLEDWLGVEISREIKVAMDLSERLDIEKLPHASYVLKTLRWAILQSSLHTPEPEGEDGYQASSEKSFVLGQQGERKIIREWSFDYYVEIFCKICDSVRTFVRVQPVKDPTLSLIPIAVYCPICGLHITENQKYLAFYHVGEIKQEIVDKFFEENHDSLIEDGFL